LAHLDLREKLGQAVGFDTRFKYGKNDRSYGDFTSYYVSHEQPNQPGSADPGGDGRYRVTFKHRLFLTDDIYATADINYISDAQFLEDYFPGEFRVDPQPDNYLSLTKWDEFYTLTLIGRWQLNKWQEVTEREPELVFDFKQHRLFGWPVYYDGESSAGEYRRAFPLGPDFNGFDFPDYDAFRFDTFHQLSYPAQFFGWLNITPRVGFRATYYNRSGTFESFTGQTVEIDPVTGLPRIFSPSIESTPLNSPTPNLVTGGGAFRPVVNAGVEVSTKISKAY
jgi:LPS-assembly protein